MTNKKNEIRKNEIGKNDMRKNEIRKNEMGRKNEKRTIWYVSTIVDPDVKFSTEKFKNIVYKVLSDPEGWQSVDNIEFQFVEPEILEKMKTKYKIPIRLSTNKTIVDKCGFSEMEKLSCCDMLTKEVWLNYYRWINGAKASKLSLDNYRSYMINHEVGHALGRLHAKCPCENCSAPIMMQHTITIGKCSPNHKPLSFE